MGRGHEDGLMRSRTAWPQPRGGSTFTKFQGTSPTEERLSDRRLVGPSLHEVAAFHGIACVYIRASCISPFLELTSYRLWR